MFAYEVREIANSSGTQTGDQLMCSIIKGIDELILEEAKLGFFNVEVEINDTILKQFPSSVTSKVLSQTVAILEQRGFTITSSKRLDHKITLKISWEEQ